MTFTIKPYLHLNCVLIAKLNYLKYNCFSTLKLYLQLTELLHTTA